MGLREAMPPLQREVNSRLRTAAEEVAAKRKAAERISAELAGVQRKSNERGVLVQELQDALKAARSEQAPLRQDIGAQAKRADQAEALAKAREVELVAARTETEEAHAARRVQEQKTAEMARRVEASQEECKQRVDEAAELLKRQIGEAERDRQRLISNTQHQEGIVAAERDQARSRVQELESELTTMARARDEVAQAHASLQREHAALNDAVAEQRVLLQTQLKEQESVQEQKDADARENVRSLKAMHQAQLEEKDKLLKQMDADVRESIQSIKSMHQSQLDQRDELLKQKEADAAERIQSIKMMHQTQLEEKEDVLKQKDADMQKNIEVLKEMYQAQLDEKEHFLKQKDVDTRDIIQSIKATHQSQMNEKEDLLKERERNLQESLQSIQNKHSSSSEQLHSERQRAQRLDEELEALRSTSEKLRTENQISALEVERLQSEIRAASDQFQLEKSKFQADRTRLEEERRRLEQKHFLDFEAAAVEAERQHSELTQAASQESDRLQTALATCRQKIDALTSDLQSTEAERAALAERAVADEEALQAQREELAKLSATLSAAREELASTVTQLAAERGENEAIRKAAGATAGDLAKTRGELEASQKHAADLGSSLDASQQQGTELKASLARTEEERDRIAERASEDRERSRVEITSLTTRLGTSEETLATCRLQYSEEYTRAERLGRERRALEVEFQSYKEHHGSSNQQQMEAISELRLMVDKLTQKVESAQVELGTKEDGIAEQQAVIGRLEDQLSAAESTRRELHNTIQELKGNIRVFCRVRPAPRGAEESLVTPEANKLSLSHGSEHFNFSFDKVFTSNSSQEAVFDEVSGLVQSALDGFKVCIFAYGQTGSGKTYTMQGTSEPSSWGLIPRSLSQIFQASQAMHKKGWEWSMQASFMEVYNEALRDLLRDGASTSAGATGSQASAHIIRHDDDWGTVVTNMTCIEVDSMEQISALTARAAKLRAVGSTDMNAVSSRSHSIFALYLKGVHKEMNQELHGALHLVDLAGSERLDRSGAVGDRLKETQNINRSLSSLADVFLAKAEGRGHTPFRNSKLTHLMEPCLSGQGKTLMVVNVGPEKQNSHETLCSLRFAGQVSQCDTGGKPKRAAKAGPGGADSAAAASFAPPARTHPPLRSARSQGHLATAELSTSSRARVFR